MKQIIEIVNKYLPQIHQNGSEEYDQLEIERLFFANNLTMYATECVKASLERAADNATAGDIKERTGLGGIWFEAEINKSSITNPDNIVLL